MLAIQKEAYERLGGDKLRPKITETFTDRAGNKATRVYSIVGGGVVATGGTLDEPEVKDESVVKEDIVVKEKGGVKKEDIVKGEGTIKAQGVFKEEERTRTAWARRWSPTTERLVSL